MVLKGVLSRGSTTVDAVYVLLMTSVLACSEPAPQVGPKGDELPTGPDAVIGQLVDVRGRPLKAVTVGIDGALAVTDENGVFAFDPVESEYALAVDSHSLHVFAGMTSRRPRIRMPASSVPSAWATVTVSLPPTNPGTQIMILGQTTQAFRDKVVAIPGIYPGPQEPTDVNLLLTWGTETPAEFTLVALEFEYDVAFNVHSRFQSDPELEAAFWFEPTRFTRIAMTTLTLEPAPAFEPSASWVPDFVPVETRELSVVNRGFDGVGPDELFVYAKFPGADQLTVVDQDLPTTDTRLAILPNIPGADFFVIAQNSQLHDGAGCSTLVPVPRDADTVEIVQGTPPELVSPENGASIGDHGELVTGFTGLHTIRVGREGHGALEIHGAQPSIALPELSGFGWTWEPEVDFEWEAIVDTPATSLESMAYPAVPHLAKGREGDITNESGETCESDEQTFRIVKRE